MKKNTQTASELFNEWLSMLGNVLLTISTLTSILVSISYLLIAIGEYSEISHYSWREISKIEVNVYIALVLSFSLSTLLAIKKIKQHNSKYARINLILSIVLGVLALISSTVLRIITLIEGKSDYPDYPIYIYCGLIIIQLIVGVLLTRKILLYSENE